MCVCICIDYIEQEEEAKRREMAEFQRAGELALLAIQAEKEVRKAHHTNQLWPNQPLSVVVGSAPRHRMIRVTPVGRYACCARPFCISFYLHPM